MKKYNSYGGNIMDVKLVTELAGAQFKGLNLSQSEQNLFERLVEIGSEARFENAMTGQLNLFHKHVTRNIKEGKLNSKKTHRLIKKLKKHRFLTIDEYGLPSWIPDLMETFSPTDF